MLLTPAKKKYLFRVYEMSLKSGTVRSTDIAMAIGISKASVANMLAVLIEDGLMKRRYDRTIGLTDLGVEFAEKLYQSYMAFHQFFTKNLKSTEDGAREDAMTCICHLTEETTEKMMHYMLQEIA